MADIPDGLSLMIAVHNREADVALLLGRWSAELARLGRPTQFIVVDDGSTDATVQKITEAGLTPIAHPERKGFGACVKAALAIAEQPIFGIVGTDYPYEPGDLRKMLAEYGKFNEEFGLSVELVNGCRTGIAVPQPWKTIGWGVRQFYRWALGNPREPLPGWYGAGEHWLNWRSSIISGNPFHDVHCAFKLIRRERLKAIPLQCDDDGVHLEIVGKLTFLTTLMAEVKLSPKPQSIPVIERGDFRRVLKSPQFRIDPIPAVAT
jgi:glycosyltransferase involved in cell wall biosynthesis